MRSYELKEKDEVVFFINQNLSHFVPIIPVSPNITLNEKCLGKVNDCLCLLNNCNLDTSRMYKRFLNIP